MKTKPLLLSLFIIMIYTSTFGQDTTLNKKIFRQKYKWAAGVGAGFTTGCGISIKYQPRKDGIQLTFLPYIDNANSREFIWTGLQYNHDLWDGRVNNIYLYVACSDLYRNRGKYYYSNGTYHNDNITQLINTGCGVGTEFDTQKRVVVDFMVGFMQYDSFDLVTITGEIALHYKFAKSE